MFLIVRIYLKNLTIIIKCNCVLIVIHSSWCIIVENPVKNEAHYLENDENAIFRKSW